ncbi:diol dehydratase small subunit [Levilactobacillus namurensis]|uniref:diol dehydratase small subunit n=1 Tax=Levilactobacillus namurensis TaxID=380393 RepID=UPI0022305176|nr:diol dehydratase small subunit [Levilactobacillus namurensis]MCW3777547.1 diol dehydratase small subunit [Levilactobacillus namurensis]MDT7018747.1 diol dehydratase small subunit [Levilactobacillus namurensis]WNN66632.1 diol dehydratase small subunit [Levilactobacillus namurensis]
MSEIDDLVAKIVQQIGDNGSASTTASQSTTTTNEKELKRNDYPLYSKHPELVRSPSGKALKDITLDNVINNNIKSNDLRITPDTLRLQGEVASDAGRDAIQRNFKRAAELTSIPDARLLEMYNALRPYRSTKAELLAISSELKDKYNAPVNAGWFAEAADYYESRKKLKGDN